MLLTRLLWPGRRYENDDKITQKMSHKSGLKAIEAALTYIEQQDKTTSHDLLLLQCRHSLTAKKRCKTLTPKRQKSV